MQYDTFGLGGRVVKASASLQEGREFDSPSRPSGYASGHCIHKPLPLPTQECTRTIGYLVSEYACHKTESERQLKQSAALPVKEVCICMNDQEK